MSFATLPVEIIGEIIWYLRTYFGEDSRNSVAAGSSISLVSRRFRLIGQGLHWRNTQCDISKIKSLAEHLTRYPHLGRMLVNLEVANLDDPGKEFTATKWDLSAFSTVIDRCEALQSLDLKIPGDVSLFRILQTAGRLRHVTRLMVIVNVTVEWTPRLVSLLTNDFPSVRELGFQTCEIQLPKRRTTLSHTLDRPRRAVNYLHLAWYGEEEDMNDVADGVLSIFDLSVLSYARLRGLAACFRTFEILSALRNLEEINLQILGDTILQTVESLVEVLPRFESLQHLRIDVLDIPEVTTTSFPVERFLNAYPPRLEQVWASSGTFTDFESIPLRAVPPGLDNTNYQSLTIWKNRVEEVIWRERDSGKSQWSRTIYEEESDNS